MIIENGKLVYKQTGAFLNTVEGSKWIFVLSTSRNLYVGEKKKGHFQHSSFLAGGATTAAGRMVAHNGVLKVCHMYKTSIENANQPIMHINSHIFTVYSSQST